MDTAPDLLLERLSQLAARWGLVTPAIAFLEANKPLSFVGSQALLMFQPIMDVLIDRQLTRDLADLLADHDRLEQLISTLEELNEDSQGLWGS